MCVQQFHCHIDIRLSSWFGKLKQWFISVCAFTWLVLHLAVTTHTLTCHPASAIYHGQAQQTWGARRRELLALGSRQSPEHTHSLHQVLAELIF